MASTQDRIRHYLGKGPGTDVTKYSDIIAMMKKMTDTEREDAISAMRAFFCLDCGRELDERELYCHCNNDE